MTNHTQASQLTFHIFREFGRWFRFWCEWGSRRLWGVIFILGEKGLTSCTCVLLMLRVNKLSSCSLFSYFVLLCFRFYKQVTEILRLCILSLSVVVSRVMLDLHLKMLGKLRWLRFVPPQLKTIFCGLRSAKRFELLVANNFHCPE